MPPARSQAQWGESEGERERELVDHVRQGVPSWDLLYMHIIYTYLHRRAREVLANVLVGGCDMFHLVVPTDDV